MKKLHHFRKFAIVNFYSTCVLIFMGDRLIIFRNLTSFYYLSSHNALHNTNGNHIENLLKGQKLVMSLPAFSIVLLSVTQICWCMYIDPTTCKSWTYLDFNIVALECTFRPKSDYVLMNKLKCLLVNLVF